MSKWKEVQFIFWDRSVILEELSVCLQRLEGSAKVTEWDTGMGCLASFVIHPVDWEFTPEEWNTISNLHREDVEIPESATFEDVKRALREWYREQEKEEKALEGKIFEAIERIVSWCSSGQGPQTGALPHKKQIEIIVKDYGQYEKTQIWEGLKSHIENSEGWTIEDLRVLAEILGVKKIEINL